MSKRQTNTIEKRNKQEQIGKARNKRWGNSDVKNMNSLLFEAREILGLL